MAKTIILFVGAVVINFCAGFAFADYLDTERYIHDMQKLSDTYTKSIQELGDNCVKQIKNLPCR